jgi:hypothetical protein
MRFCNLKIIFLISTVLQISQAAPAEDYDFSFDMRKFKVSQKPGAINSSYLPSSNSWRLGMQARLLPDFLESSGELVYGNFGEHTNTGFSNWDKYLLALGVRGKWNIIGYGFNFFSVGQQYEGLFNSEYSQKKGRAGYDSWLSLNIEKLQIKAKYLESWNSASSNIPHTQTFDSWYEVETSYPLTSSPLTEISIAYGLGERRSFITPNNIQTYQGSMNLFKTKFRFVADYFKFSTEVKQSSSKNEIGDHKDFQQEMLHFTSTLFPDHFFSINSSYRYSIDNHSTTTYQNKLNKIESSIGLVYKSVTIPANLKLTSAYKNYKSEDGLTDKDIVDFGAQLDWKTRESITGLRTDWTLSLRYKDTTNHINPTSSSSDLSLSLLWQWPIS